VVIELAGQGTDLVTATVTYTLAANVDNLALSGSAAIYGTGNGDANRLTGNGANNTLTGLGGNDTLIGGSGADTMIGGLGDDTYVVDSASDVVTEVAGQGTDTVQTTLSSYTMAGNVEALVFTNSAAHSGTGNTLANTLIGNGAANVLNGGDGADQLHGGAGADQLTGGNGSDRFYFDSLFATSNVDTVTDFTHGSDRLMLDDALFTALGVVGSTAGTALDANSFRLGSVAAEADDRILYDAATGKLYYDPTGSATAGDEVQFAVLGASVHPTLDASDFLVV
jgi:Ca2+-binding RTX toxin-like protein